MQGINKYILITSMGIDSAGDAISLVSKSGKQHRLCWKVDGHQYEIIEKLRLLQTGDQVLVSENNRDPRISWIATVITTDSAIQLQQTLYGTAPDTLPVRGQVVEI